ncbi:MAG: shikimate dehydrogenase [Oscillospiraceae bacterium]|jgi:shikimate dehydrogenase|nr:shikimate dehydrogenase [Oscillospiraceae bacterium]
MKLAVIGHPVAHSKSPLIHAKFAETLGVDVDYTAIDVTAATLPDFIELARRGFAGFNVTMPLKQEIVHYLDDTAVEAVNTVVVKNGKLTGYSTDGAGVIAALKSHYPALQNKSVVVLGSGGAAKSAIAALSKIGANLISVSRKLGNFSELGNIASTADTVINATSLGMSGCDEFASFEWLDSLKKGALIFDIVYNPVNTELLKEAAKRGLATIGGLRLLIEQAAASFELFSGTRPPKSCVDWLIETM